MNNPIKYYLEQRDKQTEIISNLKSRRNFLAIAKLLLFIAVIISIIFLVDAQITIHYLAFFACLIAFVAVAVLDTKVSYQYRLQQQLLKSVQQEIDYLNMDYTNLNQGLNYKNTKHFYSHDLDLFGHDSLFQFVNRTTTLEGKNKLASWLLGAKASHQEIIHRQEVLAETKNLADWRLLFNATGNLKEEKDKNPDIITKWLDGTTLFNKKLIPLVYLLITLNFTVIGSAFLFDINPNYPLYSAGFLLFIVFRFVKKTNKVHQKLDAFTKAFDNFHKLLSLIHNQSFESKKMNALKDILFDGDHNALLAFQKVSKLLGSFDQRSNILVTILLNGLYMRDLFLLINLDSWKKKYNNYLLDWIDAIAEVDTLNSLANYHFNNPEFIYPRLSKEKIISAKNLGHPSIPREVRISNDFELAENHKMDIITGANMAGKSTFLRTVGINLILAKCGGPVCADSFDFHPITLFTSMRTTDDLADETSYFHAELLRLKQLIILAEKEDHVFIILDEILKGTNSKDKLIGSQRFLKRLLDLPISGLIATHDLELGKLALEYPDNFKNICFEIEIEGDDIQYDYKLKPGVSQNMNATLLMEGMQLI